MISLPQDKLSLNSLCGHIVIKSIVPATIQQTMPFKINVQKSTTLMKLEIITVTTAETIIARVYSAYLPKYFKVECLK